MAYRTLGDLRVELMARLGMGAQGSSGGASQVLMNSLLRNGQDQIYRAQNWKHLTDYQEKTLGVGQNLLDYPTVGAMVSTNTSARDKRVTKIERYFSGEWTALDEGISTELWNTMDSQSYPCRFDRYAQILIYPKADQVYTVRIWFIADLGRFTEDGDFASLDDEMVLLHALANGKAHYRHPDAATYQGQLTQLMASLRGQSFNLQGVYRRDDTPPPLPKPVRV